MPQKRTRRILLGIATSLLISNSNAARHHHRQLYQVDESSSAANENSQKSLRARRESFRREEDDIHEQDIESQSRRLRRASKQHQQQKQQRRRTQTLIENLNAKTHKVAVETFYNADPKPNRPLLETTGMRLNKVAQELFLDDEMLGEMLEVTQTQFSVVSILETYRDVFPYIFCFLLFLILELFCLDTVGNFISNTTTFSWKYTVTHAATDKTAD
mmetsp:Transcript_28183/g.68608  ORF Transcript_28183/g.68608 Transcript_28183/m.68608 type:complete len:216 (-) Transcript_28183:1320-1967(-)